MGVDIHTQSNRKKHAREFLDHAGVLARIIDSASDAIVSVDGQRSIILFNQGAEKMFGYTAEEVKEKPLEFLLPSGLYNESFSTAPGDGERREVRGRCKDGTEFPAEASLSAVPLEGQNILTLIMQDVSGRTFAEERLRTTLREREVLLEEIHHRVKNNLQVITSLLGLQARSIKDSATRKKFDESLYRIQAIAILHDILCQSASLAEIDFADYIRRLAEHLVRSYGASGRIRMHISLDPIYCHRDVASPCGLIVNELLSNAFKYAFPGGKSGEVRMELRREPEGRVQLLVGDNGIGLPPDLNWETSSTLGLRLVRTLARQMEAKVEIDSRNGTTFVLRFVNGLTNSRK
jgi:PAS domain S-box-containing protein